MGDEVAVDGVLEKIVSFGSALQFLHQWRLDQLRLHQQSHAHQDFCLALGHDIFIFRFRIEYCILCSSDNFCALFLGSPGTRDNTGVEIGRTRDMNVSRLTVSTARPQPLHVLVGHIYFFLKVAPSFGIPMEVFFFFGVPFQIPWEVVLFRICRCR